MVTRTSTLIVATIGFFAQAVGCSDPAQELCDQPEGGGSDDVGDDGSGLSLEHAGVLPSQVPKLTSSDPEVRTALAHETKSSMLDADDSLTFRNGTFEDPRVPVTDEAELQSYPLRTVVSIFLSHEVPNGIRKEKGTGFLAGPRHVITNRHVIQVDGVDINDWIEDPPPLFSFEVFPGRSNLAMLNGGAWTVERVIWNPFIESEYNDYALLILEDDVERSGQYGRLGLCSASSNTLDGRSVVMAGYPKSTFQCGQTPEPPDPEGGDCPCGGWMYTQSCEISEVDPQEIVHTCMSQDGQSGSPLWVDECVSNNTRCTVGINYGKSGLSSTAVRWRNEDIEWLHSNICAWPSAYAAMPPFCN